MARTSLETGKSSSKPAASKGKTKGSELDRGQKIKLGIAVGAIVVAALLLAYQFELLPSFGGAPVESDVPPEVVREVEEKIEAERNAPPPPPNAPTRTGSQ